MILLTALILGLLIALSVAPLFAEVSVVTDGQVRLTDGAPVEWP